MCNMKLVAILLACALVATASQPPPANAHTSSPHGPPSPTAILFCSADAQQYCSAESASVTTEAAVLKLLKCFNVHETSLSPACQRALAPLPEYQCASDVMALCSTAVSSGRRAVAECLQKNSQDVSATCTAAMQRAHQPHRQRGHGGHQGGPTAPPNGPPNQSPDNDGQRRGGHSQHGRRHGQHGGRGGHGDGGNGGDQGAPPDADSEHHHGPHHGHHHPPGGLIVLGGLVAVAIVGFVVWRVRKRRRARVAAQREAVGMQQASAPPQVVVATGQPTGVQASPVTYTSGITGNGYARLHEQQV